ncbi:DUF2513 domain-containing protein [Vibrio fluvialis]|uniref:DUF2513 domain-containing protein n=1 Tax=Vibrio fluvialis TaxID=676 RepID=UPI001EECB3F4|nr:DUF2513 domain-containing protein [Vibrio fluvialis]MCG6412669.1 DUF2513 domain-containing protein [Vibrio fluvialis]MDZ5514436.1 DUF2513 domain-containing protein [Vibrio fluvialis]
MKRDMALIRRLLLSIEKHPDRISGFNFDDYKPEDINYHVALLIDVGLLEGDYVRSYSSSSMAPARFVITSMTWAGHEFLDNLRQEDIWNVIKTKFKDDSVATVIAMAKELAMNFAKKKLKILMDENES